jgi:coproporphyrinogen III oxidase
VSNRSTLAVFLPICFAGMAAGVSSASVATQPSGSAGDTRLTTAANREEQTWYFDGTARYICDLTGKEASMTFSGITDRMTRDQAMEFAKESGAAQAARRGRVVSVNVRTIW